MALRFTLATLFPLLTLLSASSLSAQGVWERVDLPIPIYVSLQDAGGERLLGRVEQRTDTLREEVWATSRDGISWQRLPLDDSIRVLAGLFTHAGTLVAVDGAGRIWRERGSEWIESAIKPLPTAATVSREVRRELTESGPGGEIVTPTAQSGRMVEIGYSFKKPTASFMRYGDTLIVAHPRLVAISFDDGVTWEEALPSVQPLPEERIVGRFKGNLRVAAPLARADQWAIATLRTGPDGSTYHLADEGPLTRSRPHTIGNVEVDLTYSLHSSEHLSWTITPSGTVAAFGRHTNQLYLFDRSGNRRSIPLASSFGVHAPGFRTLVSLSDSLLFGANYSGIQRISIGPDSVRSTTLYRLSDGPTDVLGADAIVSDTLLIRTPFFRTLVSIPEGDSRPTMRPVTAAFSRSDIEVKRPRVPEKSRYGTLVTAGGYQLFDLEGSRCWPSCAVISGRQILKGTELLWQVYARTEEPDNWSPLEDVPLFTDRPTVQSRGSNIYLHASPYDDAGESKMTSYSFDLDRFPAVAESAVAEPAEIDHREVTEMHLQEGRVSSLAQTTAGVEVQTTTTEGDIRVTPLCQDRSETGEIEKFYLTADESGGEWLATPCGVYRLADLDEGTWREVAPAPPEPLHDVSPSLFVVAGEVYAVTREGLWHWRE